MTKKLEKKIFVPGKIYLNWYCQINPIKNRILVISTQYVSKQS